MRESNAANMPENISFIVLHSVLLNILRLFWGSHILSFNSSKLSKCYTISFSAGFDLMESKSPYCHSSVYTPKSLHRASMPAS